MRKTILGFVLVGGIVVACIAALYAYEMANNANPMDDSRKYVGFVGVLVGAAMFFFGALQFAKVK